MEFVLAVYVMATLTVARNYRKIARHAAGMPSPIEKPSAK
jgi:hypothetical protein